MPLQTNHGRLLAISFILAAAAHTAAAQDPYPAKAIKVVVPVPPGAAADILPRIVMERLALRFSRPVVVENRPGANSNTGAELVAKARPDGYTLLASPPPPLVINSALGPLRYDPAAFVPIATLAKLPNVLVARPDAPFSTLQQMLEFARAHPRRLTYASAGNGSSPHLAMEWLDRLAGVLMTHVPYNGLPQAMTHVLGGHVDVMFNNTANVLRPVRDGKLVALGVDSLERMPEMPDVPAIAETFHGFEMSTWFALVAPPGTPAEIANMISSAIAQVLQEPQVSRRFKELAATVVATTPAETGVFLEKERTRWSKIVAAAAIKTD